MIRLVYQWTLSITILLCLATIFYEVAPKTCESSTAVSIGYCDFMGYCSIVSEKGTLEIVQYPILNYEIKYNCEIDWNSLNPLE